MKHKDLQQLKIGPYSSQYFCLQDGWQASEKDCAPQQIQQVQSSQRGRYIQSSQAGTILVNNTIFPLRQSYANDIAMLKVSDWFIQMFPMLKQNPTWCLTPGESGELLGHLSAGLPSLLLVLLGRQVSVSSFFVNSRSEVKMLEHQGVLLLLDGVALQRGLVRLPC